MSTYANNENLSINVDNTSLQESLDNTLNNSVSEQQVSEQQVSEQQVSEQHVSEQQVSEQHVSEQQVSVQFGADDADDSDNSDNEKQEESLEELKKKYTVVDVDHLDEDVPIRGQEYCLFSFMTPEGLMNCNVRAVKFRGAYATMAEAEKKAKELEKTDKYFQIFIGESGKWLDFNPPVSRVEQEKSSNKEHQKILDAQRKQRMNKINALAGKHKEMLDKKDKGKEERITESKKAGAASDAVDKQKTKKQEKVEQKQEKQEKVNANSRGAKTEKFVANMRKRFEETQKKRALEKMSKEEKVGKVNEVDKSQTQTNSSKAEETPVNIKSKVVETATNDLEDKKRKLDEADKNIEKIKQLMAKKRAE